MAANEFLRNAADGPLIAMALPYLVDESDVSERTAATRGIGAFNLARSLMCGTVERNDEHSRALVGELLGRMVANAERQGIAVEAPIAKAD